MAIEVKDEKMSCNDKILILVQGPHHRKMGKFNTIEELEFKEDRAHLRDKFYIVCALWKNEKEEIKQQLSEIVDEIIIIEPPTYKGPSNRYMQAKSVHDSLKALEDRDFKYVLKTRSDIRLSKKFLELILKRASQEAIYERLLVANVFARLEPFHLSDFVVFSTYENIQSFYNYDCLLYYSDLYSPEVEFTRAFIRNKKLPYHNRLDDSFAFIRDHVEIIDLNKFGIIWFKHPKFCVSECNIQLWFTSDRDAGPVMALLYTEWFYKFIRYVPVPFMLTSTVLLILDLILRLILVTWGRISGTSIRSYHMDPIGPEYSKPITSNRNELKNSHNLELFCKYNKRKIQKRIDKFAKQYQGKKVLLYGAGTFAELIFKEFDLSKFDVVGIADKKYGKKGKTGELYYGNKTYAPYMIRELKYDVIFSLLQLSWITELMTRKLLLGKDDNEELPYKKLRNVPPIHQMIEYRHLFSYRHLIKNS